MSKSTNTMGAIQDDENINPNTDLKRQEVRQNTPTRDVNFKDISNSAVLGTMHGEDGRKPAKKKLIIPLEPDFDDNVFVENVAIVEQVKKNAEKEHSQKNGRLSRKKTGSKNKSRYQESPQTSLMKWAKPVLKTDNGATQTKTCAEAPDCELTRSGRKCRKAKNPDFLYADLRKRKHPVNNVCDGSSSEDEDICDDDDGVMEERAPNSKRKKLDSPNQQKDLCNNQSGKHNCKTSLRSSDSTRANVSSKSVLKTGRQPLKRSKAVHKKVSSTSQASKCTIFKQKRTVDDYFLRGSSNTCDGQEELDRRMAMELQRQYELEAKLNLNSMRFKGSSEQYDLRK